jgi:hypothetical protein
MAPVILARIDASNAGTPSVKMHFKRLGCRIALIGSDGHATAEASAGCRST